MWKILAAFVAGLVVGVGLIVWLAEAHMRRVRRTLRELDDKRP